MSGRRANNQAADAAAAKRIFNALPHSIQRPVATFIIGFGLGMTFWSTRHMYDQQSQQQSQQQPDVTKKRQPRSMTPATALTPAAGVDAPVGNSPFLSQLTAHGLPTLPFYQSEPIVSSNVTTPLPPPYLLKETYVSYYNTKTKNPDWVLEYLNKDMLSHKPRPIAVVTPTTTTTTTATSTTTATAITSSPTGRNNNETAVVAVDSTTTVGEVADRKHSHFHSDPAIYPLFQAANSDYFHSGYDRGHMAPAADAMHSQKAMNETFSLTNMSPQDPHLNRFYWADFERLCRSLTSQLDDLWIITGPLWLSSPLTQSQWKTRNKQKSLERAEVARKTKEMYGNEQTEFEPGTPPPIEQLTYEVLGDNHVHVPTHYFKVVLGRKSNNGAASQSDSNNSSSSSSSTALTSSTSSSSTDSQYYLTSFVIPNRPVPQSTPLTTFRVPLSQVEHASGFTFFPAFPRDDKHNIIIPDNSGPIPLPDSSSSSRLLLPASSSTSYSAYRAPLDICDAGHCEWKSNQQRRPYLNNNNNKKEKEQQQKEK